MPNKKKVSDEVLTESYSRLNNIWEVAKEVGLSGQTIHERLTKIGVQKKMNKFFVTQTKLYLTQITAMAVSVLASVLMLIELIG